MKKIPSLDGLRAISILLVLLAHASDTVGVPSHFYKYSQISFLGILGVNIFFVISGFLITYLLLNEKKTHQDKIDIKKFYQRRFLRILPVCYLYILVVFLLNKPLNLDVKNINFLYAITYTVNFTTGLGAYVLGHLWTLSIEEQFYFFWPWVTKLSFKKMINAVLFILAYAPIARIITRSHAMSHFHPIWKILMLAPFFQWADCLMIGCLLAISQQTHPDLWKSQVLKNRFVFLLAIPIMFFVSYLCDHGRAAIFILPFGRTIISLCIAYIIAYVTMVKDSWAFKFLNHPLMVYIGVLSYSIYIWQQLFLFAKERLIAPVLWFEVFPLNILLAFCVAIISYHLWERNFLKIKENFKVKQETRD